MVSQQKHGKPGSSIVFSVHYKKITANPGLWLREGSFKKKKKIERPKLLILLSFPNANTLVWEYWCVCLHLVLTYFKIRLWEILQCISQVSLSWGTELYRCVLQEWGSPGQWSGLSVLSESWNNWNLAQSLTETSWEIST